MFPVVATGALNPESGFAAAVLTADLTHAHPTLSSTPLPMMASAPGSQAPAPADGPAANGPATGVALHYGADRLAAQIQEALARCRRLGHRQPAVTLMRPAAVVAGVERLLADAGLAVTVAPSRVAGVAVLTVRS